MPRLDGTGPRGMGPMTGRGMGNCGGYRRAFAPCGYGLGRFGALGRPSYRQPSIDEEKAMIQEDIESLKEELKAAEEQLMQLTDKK